MHWTLLAALLFGTTAQESAESLIRKLDAGSIDVRSKAVQDLIQLGTDAVPALEKACGSSNREVAYHAKQCLDRIEVRLRLTPALLAIEGLDRRLAKGDPEEWTRFFLEVLPWQPGSPYAKLRPADLEVLVDKAIEGAPDGQLLQVLAGAGQYRLKNSRRQVEKLTRSPSPQFRAAAVRVLLRLEGEGALEKAAPFLKDPDAKVRGATVETLADLGIREAIPRMVAMTDDPAMGLSLGSAFWRLRAKEGIPHLIRLSSSEVGGDVMTRNTATMYLSFYAGPEVLPHMRGLLKWMQTDPNTSDSALRHLGDWGDRDSIPGIEAGLDLEKLWGRSVTRALYSMGGPSAASLLIKLAPKSHSGASQVLGRIGERKAIPVLRELLAKGDPEAALALGELGDRESIPALRNLLAHRDLSPRVAASTALALLDDQESAQRIGAMDVAGVAKRIWPVLQGRATADGAALALDRPDRGSSYWDSEYHPQIQEGTNSTYGLPRYLAVRANATVRAGAPAEALEAILEKEGDEYPGVIAAAALVRMGRKEGVSWLLQHNRTTFGLNALRSPGTWAKLEAKTTALKAYATYEQIHRTLAKEAGLDVEGPPAGSDAHRAWTAVHQAFRKWGRPATIAEGFEMIEDFRWSVILESDRIRIVPIDEALPFWREWAKRLPK